MPKQHTEDRKNMSIEGNTRDKKNHIGDYEYD